MFLSLFVCASPCWFSAAVLHRTLCVWHKLSWTVPVKYKKFYTEIQQVLHKNTTELKQRYREKKGTEILRKKSTMSNMYKNISSVFLHMI